MIIESVKEAFNLIILLDQDVMEIVSLSLQVSLMSVILAVFAGVFIGSFLALSNFPLRNSIILIFNVLMGLPPVVAGLIIYIILSASGPLGVYNLLYTPTAMVIAQFILILPFIVTISRQVVEDLSEEYAEFFSIFGLTLYEKIKTMLWDGRYSLLTAVMAGLGRALSEVGAVLIVGGNINHYTRTMTTTIAMETSKGDISRAISLGVILLVIALGLNLIIHIYQTKGKKHSYV